MRLLLLLLLLPRRLELQRLASHRLLLERRIRRFPRYTQLRGHHYPLV